MGAHKHVQKQHTSNNLSSDVVRKRHVQQGGLGAAGGAPGKHAERTFSDDGMEKVISELPDWKTQLSLRGYIVGTALGMLFVIIGLKLSLGTAGIIPSLNIPGGLISFACIRSLTALGGSLNVGERAPLAHRLLFQPFGLQENAVMQTYILSMGVSGFGSYLTGMGYQAYLNLGGAPKGSPGFSADAVFDPVPSRTIPYLLLTSVLGAFLLTQMRKLMICDWKLPFPSGTASGIMLMSFHTSTGEASALRKVKVLLYTGLASLQFSILKWFFQGSDYACGFGVWPTFGLKALKWTWNFDFQLNYVGAGMICPHIVNWSMLLGAVLSWGIMWPLLEKKAGDWYPSGLGAHDFGGLFGYKVFLVIAILMGEGLYMVCKVLLSTYRDGVKRVRANRAAANLPKFSKSAPSDVNTLLSPSIGPTSSKYYAAGTTSDSDAAAGNAGGGGKSVETVHAAGAAGSSSSCAAAAHLKDPEAIMPTAHGEATVLDGVGGSPSRPAAAAAAHDASLASLEHHKPPAMADGLVVDEDTDASNLLQFKETPEERRLRTEVFLRETIPWWLAPLGYGGLATLSTICIPFIYPPVRWYYVLVAYAMVPLFAVPNSYGCGLTDWDMASMYGKLALFVFAAWAGTSGNGVIVGLGICGVVLSATSAAAVLMGDFRTGYICLAAPRAMFTAQLVGQTLGAVLSPFAFMLFFKTGQVNVPGGPYPAPFADIYRGMALIGTKGFGALPKYCNVLMGAFFLAGILICLIRDLVPKRWAAYVPSPMALCIPFYIGAASAIDFWLGSVVMHVWEFINKDAALELGPTVGAGLLVGDGLWSIPSSILAIAGKAPPVCMGFYGKPMCNLPYCIGFWRGGSARIPTA